MTPYHLAPRDWEIAHPNSFTSDDAYDRAWGCFQLLSRDDESFWTGRVANGLFLVRMGRRVPDLICHLCDFLRYEQAHGRQVIVAAPAGVDVAEMIHQAWEATADKCTIRESDPPVIIHTTTCESWQAIAQDGMLKSTACLHREGITAAPSLDDHSPITEYQRNEPAEYIEHIMFGQPGQYWAELIVLSKLHGVFCQDGDVVYTPGVRLYLDLHAILRDGLGVRDGLHLVKVRDHLPLSPYLLGTVGVGDIDPDGLVPAWTPKTFTEEADRFFFQQHAMR